MIRRCSLLAMLALTACAGSPGMPFIPAGGPSFAPIDFFAGHTDGVGRLKVIMSHAGSVHVEGDGHVGRDGTLTLVQHIEQEGKPAHGRRWSLRATGSGTYAVDLSDAVGPVSAKVDGNILHIRFRAKRGLGIEQWLALQPGGREARNHLVVRKFGVPVAVLDETIRKID